MSTQMTVRLSDVATQHVDALVAAGTFPSRAAYLTWLVEGEVQKEQGWKEILRMRREGIPMDDPNAAAIAKATSGRSLAHLD